ncbi:MAG: hypothetical protein TU36_005270, partial [Vulcanisaeta sp. AZ3]
MGKVAPLRVGLINLVPLPRLITLGSLITILDPALNQLPVIFSSVYEVPVLISSPSISLNVFTVPPQVFPGYYDVRVEAVV